MTRARRMYTHACAYAVSNEKRRKSGHIGEIQGGSCLLENEMISRGWGHKSSSPGSSKKKKKKVSTIQFA